MAKAFEPWQKAAFARLNDILDVLDLDQHPIPPQDLMFLQTFLSAAAGEPKFSVEKHIRDVDIAVDVHKLERSIGRTAAYIEVGKRFHLEHTGIRKIYLRMLNDPIFHFVIWGKK